MKVSLIMSRVQQKREAGCKERLLCIARYSISGLILANYVFCLIVSIQGYYSNFATTVAPLVFSMLDVITLLAAIILVSRFIVKERQM